MTQTPQTTPIAAFDLEIFNIIPDGETDWSKHRPFGIACAAIQLRGAMLPPQTLQYYNTTDPSQPMTQSQCVALVLKLQQLATDGFTIVTHNGMAFDFHVLAEESDMYSECAQLAFNHCDTMFPVTRVRGHFVSLDKVTAGMGVTRKLGKVRLKSGAEVAIEGKLAPRLWQQGEYAAVLTYLNQDVACSAEIAQAIIEQGQIRWINKGNNPDSIALAGLPTVMDALQMERTQAAWLKRHPYPYTRMITWTKHNLYLVSGLYDSDDNPLPTLRVAAVSQDDAVAVAADAFGGVDLLSESTVEERWINPVNVEDDSAEAGEGVSA